MEPAELAHLTTLVLAGTQAMPAAELIDPADSYYTGPPLALAGEPAGRTAVRLWHGVRRGLQLQAAGARRWPGRWIG
jgi:hypothetical protein